MIRINYFLTLLSIVLYQTIIEVLKPAVNPLVKICLTLLIWISFFLSFSEFIKNYRNIKTDFPKIGFNLFFIILGWNIYNILRSTVHHDEPIFTHLGNPVTSLALLVPFSLSFYYKNINLKTLNSLLISLIIVALPVFLIFLMLTNGINKIHLNYAFLLFINGTNFLIPLLGYQSIKKKVIIVIGSILLFYLGMITEYRIVLIRIILLYFGLILFLILKGVNRKFFLYPALLSFFFPFLFLFNALQGNISTFEEYSAPKSNQELYTDTRTFLYAEVYDDLITNHALLWVKGSSGKYYSPYFDQYGGDTENRLSVEVGVLAILLKGGIIAVLLNFIILFVAIFYAFFRSNNDLTVCIGGMLIIHVIILFITNYLDYSLYNILLWFFIGICLSGKFRGYSNEDIKKLLFYD